ncbi:MAG TPA: hypothetical protein VFC92_04895 [Bacteroidales bacterium]|nr:hypothetical protein [Bacteroidales bacterium]
MTSRTIFFVALFSIFSSLFFISCDSNDDPPIDIGYVNFQIYPNSTQYLPLNNIGGYAYVTALEPSRGIIIYRATLEDFKAFERTPTYKPDSCCVFEPVFKCTRLIVDESALFAVDTCTGSRYLLLDGSAVEGPATYPMVQYNTRYVEEVLYVFN